MVLLFVALVCERCRRGLTESSWRLAEARAASEASRRAFFVIFPSKFDFAEQFAQQIAEQIAQQIAKSTDLLSKY